MIWKYIKCKTAQKVDYNKIYKVRNPLLFTEICVYTPMLYSIQALRVLQFSISKADLGEDVD